MMIAAGHQLAELVSDPILQTAMADMAIVLADPNPIHLDPEAVRKVGLGEQTVVQGPITLGLMLEMLRRALPEARLHSLDVRYLANAFAGDRVQVTGGVDEISGRSLRCSVVAEIAGEGRQVATATAILTTA